MGKASRTKSDFNRRERIAVQRAAQRRREQRQRLLIAGGSILAVVVIVVGFVVWKSSSSGSSGGGNTSNGPTGTTLTKVTSEVTGVPASALASVGAGGSSLGGGIKGISETALTSGGKPEVFFYGAEYCPYCAANRWGLIVALSRFGTFTGLKTIHSSATDSPASVPTWTFDGSSYTSKYVSFVSVETLGNVAGSNGEYPTLQTPTSAETAIVTKYDGSQGSIPFVDFGGKYDQSGDLAMLQPTNLSGDWETIAGDLSQPSTSNAKAVDGAANFMTAAICKLTNNQPATACTSTVQALESQL
jgi:hypothetical protein